MLVCLSAHQRTTPFVWLERLSAVGDTAVPHLVESHDSIRGAVVVSTCNRFEAYIDLADDSTVPALDAAVEKLATLSDLPHRTVRENIDFVHGNGAIRHLFSVAAGLDSVVVGEDEIAGQVRRALDTSRRHGHTTTSLESLFQRATETSRDVKNATKLGAAGRSVVRVALEMASSRVVDWSVANVLLIGTGRYAAASLAALRAHGAENISVYSPSGRGAVFASRHDLTLVSDEQYLDAVLAAEIVVSCTTTNTGFALTADDVKGSASTTHSRLIVDLGMPRNIDPTVVLVPGFDVLDLDTVRLHAPMDDFAELTEAHEIVAHAANRHAVSRRVHEVSPSVVEVRGFINDVLQAELGRAQSSSGDTEAALRHFAGVLTHRLIAQGHTLAAAGSGAAWADAVSTVLGTTPSVNKPDGSPA